MKVLICGSRNIRPERLLRRIISCLPPETVIMHGAARGVDSTAGEVAMEMKHIDLRVQSFPARWEDYGARAGPIRNQIMLEQGPDIVIAIHDDPYLGKGTADMVARSRAAGVPVFIFLVDKNGEPR